MKRQNVNNFIVEEILMCLYFGQTTFEDFNYIFSMCESKNIYFNKILSYLEKNYDKVLNDINTKITDEAKRNEIISKLEKLFILKFDKIVLNSLEKWFNCSNNGKSETIKNYLDKYMNSLTNENELNHKMIFYLLLINHLSNSKITEQDMFKKIFAKKFKEEDINSMMSRGEELAQKFNQNFPYDIKFLLSKKHNKETEDSELIVLFLFFLCFEQCKKTENKQSILNTYFKYFLEFDLSKSIYSTFNQILYQYCQQKFMKVEYYYDFLVQMINKSNDLTVSKNESKCIILKNFMNCIIKLKENANLSKIDNQKFALYLESIISSPRTEKDEDTLINLFRALITINQKYRKTIWKTCKDMFLTMLNSSIINKKLVFALTFFIKYHKINQKKESLKDISDRLKLSNKHNKMFELLLILVYSSKIRCNINQQTSIYNCLNIIKDSKQNIQKLNDELKQLKDYNYNSLELMINENNLGDDKILISQGKYDEKKGEIKLTPLAHLNKVEIKHADLSQAKELINKHKGFKQIEGNLQMLGVVILYTKHINIETHSEHVFLYNKYNQFWYYCNTKEFILEVSINTYTEQLKNIVLYFFLIDNNCTKINEIWKAFNKNEKQEEFLPWEFKENIIWLEANDIKLSYEFLLTYFKNDYYSFESLCQYIIESRTEPKIKSEEEKNALENIIAFYNKGKEKKKSSWIKKVLKLVDKYK